MPQPAGSGRDEHCFPGSQLADLLDANDCRNPRRDNCEHFGIQRRDTYGIAGGRTVIVRVTETRSHRRSVITRLPVTDITAHCRDCPDRLDAGTDRAIGDFAAYASDTHRTIVDTVAAGPRVPNHDVIRTRNRDGFLDDARRIPERVPEFGDDYAPVHVGHWAIVSLFNRHSIA